MFKRLRGVGWCLLPRKVFFFSDDPGSNDVPRKGILAVSPTRCNQRRGTGVWRVPSSSRGMSGNARKQKTIIKIQLRVIFTMRFPIMILRFTMTNCKCTCNLIFEYNFGYIYLLKN